MNGSWLAWIKTGGAISSNRVRRRADYETAGISAKGCGEGRERVGGISKRLQTITPQRFRRDAGIDRPEARATTTHSRHPGKLRLGARLWLYVRNAGASGLFEMDFGTQQ